VNRAAALLTLALALPSPAGAQGYDPRYRWRTLETPRFRVHFHQGLEPLAQRAALAFERAHEALSPLLGHAPAPPVDVVLSDDVDDANGSAQVVPRNVVRIFAVPPVSLSELGDHGDWLESVVFHEYVHVLHMDNVSGLPGLLNAVFGKVMAPGGLGPPWLTEGLAVLHEAGPGAGRNASALFDMWARAQVLERGAPPGLPVISSLPLEWPGGHLWYLLGGRFLAFLRERHGDAALRAFAADQGAQIWPWFMNTLAERHFGQGFDALWAEFGAHLRERYRSQAAAAASRPPTAYQVVTRRGAEVSRPRFAPDGRSLAYADRGPDERGGLRRAGLDGRDLGRLATVEQNGTFAFLPDGRILAALGDLVGEYRTWDDLWLLGPGRRRTRLTTAERATDPDVDAGGASAVYVARLPGGEQALRRLRLDGGALPETLLQRPGAQIFLPRLSPDGRRVALEIQEGGRRDIAIWDGSALAFVTDDDAIDSAPCWSPDGRVLLFASDRGGIYDVYAFEFGGPSTPPEPAAAATPTESTATPIASPTATAASTRSLLPGRLRQVTNVLTGALQPEVSPDGSTLAFLTYSAAGYDVATTALDPSAWLAPPEVAPRPGHRLPPAPGAPLPSRPYRSRETVAPTWWLPLLGGDGAGTTVGAATGGADVVGLHAWALSAEYGIESRRPGYDLAYAGGWMHPGLTLASSLFLGTTPDSPSRLEHQWIPLDAGLTWTRTHLDSAHAIRLGWRALSHDPLSAADPTSPAPYRGATASEASVGLAYGNARRFTRSISREEGGLLSLRLRIATPDLGGDQRYASARLSGSTFLRLPGTRHAVLALHASLGASTGTIAGRQPFSIGGIPGPDLATIVAGALGGGFPAQTDQLRGYPQGVFSGTTLASGTAELRFPLLAPSLGYSTWPLLLRRLHGALFLDAGGAFRQGDGEQGRRLGDLRRLRFGAGAELRLEVVLGYQLRTDLRLGVARGLGPLLAPSPKPADPFARTEVYFTLGEAF